MFFATVEYIRSRLICISTAMMPIFFLLGVLRLTLSLICLALLPAAAGLYSNYPVLLGFDMRPVEIAKVDLEKKLALLWYLLWVLRV